MNAINYTEDQKKLRTLSVKVIILSAIVFVLGIIILKGNSSDFSMLGYMKAALGGCLLGGGGAALFTGFKSLLRTGKPPQSILSADANGVIIKTTGTNTRLIAWQDIESFSPAKKGIQSGVAVILKDPSKYERELSAKEKAAAKQNKNFLGSPAAVNTRVCLVSKEEIAGELNNCLKSIQASK